MPRQTKREGEGERERQKDSVCLVEDRTIVPVIHDF